MRARERRPWGPALAAALALAPATSRADPRSPAPPWDRTRPNQPSRTAPPAEVPPDAPRARRWPTIRPSPPRAPRAPLDEEPLPTRARSAAPDLGEGSYFQLPSARVLRYGDVVGRYVSHLGWAGVRAGLSRYVDVGVGLPYYFAGVSVDARVSFVQSARFSAAWWGYATVPFLGEGERPTSHLGFTWAYAGLGWMTGPLVTANVGRFTASGGLHLAQRTGLGGVWLVGHVTADLRVTNGVKLLAQVASFFELSLEQGDRARALLGNGEARVLPYAQGGVRFFGRLFAADMGVLVPLSEDCPLWSPRLAVIPSISLTHRF